MIKGLTRVRRLFSTGKTLLIVVALVFMGIGFVMGYFVGNNDEPTITDSTHHTRRQHERNEQRDEQFKERLEQGYKASKKTIDRDVKDKKLTEENAKLVNKKLDEAYGQLKQLNYADEEARKKYRELRREWQKWSENNNVSRLYLMKL